MFYPRENKFPFLFSIYPTKKEKKKSQTQIKLFYVKLKIKTNSYRNPVWNPEELQVEANSTKNVLFQNSKEKNLLTLLITKT